MRFLVLLAFALPAFAQQERIDREIQRALIERDQRTAEFAARLRGLPPEERQRLQNLLQRQQLEVAPDLPNELLPYVRQKAEREREAFVLRLPPPVVRGEVPEQPLPLPAKTPPAVDVVPGER